jgi:cytochrome bd ubiquinol oxidase subunit II
MIVFAFWLLAAMLSVYVLLDGYDLGVATITPFVARTDEERAATMRSIGPFWNGNEVWLIATAAVLFALFPKAYAASFSGFYLPFIVVLWLLMVRGIAMELRGHFPSAVWHDFWDACFFLSSLLLVFVFGITLGNLIRGLPLDSTGFFQGTFAFLLNPYALLVGSFGIATLALHGASFLVWRTNGPPALRARAAMPWVWTVVLVFYVIVTLATLWMRGGLVNVPRLWLVALVALAVAALISIRITMPRNASLATFLASSLFVATLVVAAAATVFPYLIPGYPTGTGGISIFAAAPSPSGIAVTLGVALVGLAAVLVYSLLAYRYLISSIEKQPHPR